MAIPARMWYGFALRKEESTMRKILEDFYFGNIIPSVRIMTPNSKLRRMVNNVTRCENQLKEQLSETEQALLTGMWIAPLCSKAGWSTYLPC